jgi:hypothetical protein
MTTDERTIVEALDKAVQSAEAQARIRPIVERVRANLARKPDSVMTWEPIPLTNYSGILPGQIKSSWIFILRAGANTGAERHPNSHQRMMSFAGTGDMQVGRPKSEAKVRQGADIEWQSNVLISNSDAPLEKRWISIPQNVWHQPVVSQEEDWVVVSFHTVPAEQLIEERPDDRSGSGTTQMVYLEKSAPASDIRN